MKKRWKLCAMFGLGIAAVAVMVEPTHVVRGWLRGERFFAGRPTSYWSTAIRDPQARGRFYEAAGLVLGNEPEPAAVPVLVELLEDEDDEVRFVACNALAANGSAARPAVPALLRMLGHSNLFYRRNASLVLASIGPDASAIDILNGALEEEDPWVNYHAAIAVAKLGPEGKPAVPALLKLMKGNKATKEIMPNFSLAYEVRKQGEHTLVEVGPGIPRVPGTGTVGYAAFYALLQIDPEVAKDALPR